MQDSKFNLMLRLQDIPKDYGYCLQTSDSCPQAATCLRAKAAQLLLQNRKAKTYYITCVHPCILANAKDNECPLYRNDKPKMFARGMTKLFDNLPLKLSQPIKQKVKNCFSSERTYYKCRSGELLTSPEIQAEITRIFKSAGIEETSQFDSYEECPDW